ncbi:PLDc N-terminal domain-containing protein [Brochothrix campestris]|uniref:Cardiolipin synthase N-terminal domain-containing protein n=1 Tax=Brochothrix campestris FSL F6-1037 TaxID=1265861 RepID=W7CH79_9LIST|nr:PLDc N-terminal domain-containing protein [Brochothrix campestris]EUJ36287.1 hypothetical protein BCAMP_10760 [Brochothrix campestris FSL F6-1037]
MYNLIMKYPLYYTMINLALLTFVLIHASKQPNSRFLPKWGWLLIILLIQIIGPILYFIFGVNRRAKNARDEGDY